MKKLNLSILNDFQIRQKLMAVFVSLGIVFILFYTTSSILNNKKDRLISDIDYSYNRLVEVQNLSAGAVRAKLASAQLSNSLLAYVQSSGGNLVGNKLTGIRLLSSAGGQEQVTFRTENLTYTEAVMLIKEFERYENVWIKNLSFLKRYDNSQRVDISWEIVRRVR